MTTDDETRLADARAILADIAHHDDFTAQRAASTVCALSDDAREVKDARRLAKRLEGAAA
ncbi:hypothetical protein [Sulfitobacter pacificus]|uniref:Uncharacterized protein n=1 Tax=Sulfitobacter pacificus TaxID=1499314 RepID=A0ABQ5VGB1_9RHOB|nr:hypothetical protein [Sulfitobacter pacificus]GLQ26109.1 hypothetical protein GCM10007927_09120 [Sulfitobacter pacificus]